MATAYIRNLAQSGVIPDVDAYDLSLTTLSMGVNTRCQDGHVERGPVCRRAGTLPAPPDFGVSYDLADGSATSMVVADDGRVHEWSPQTSTDRTPTGWSPSVSAAPTTATILNDVVFINRSDRTPWYRAKSAAGSFSRLETYNSNNGGAQFGSNIRFNSLRATANILVGINVTKDGQTFGNMVKWSNYGDQGLPPRDWDVTGIIYQNGQEVALSAAGENTLAEMTGYLVDGCKLGNNLVLYGSREAWLMEFVGGTAIFTFRRLFDAGVLSVNCVVEKEGAHFVFGDNDIYAHDGTGTRTSIAQGKVRQFIYRNIVKTEGSRSFVAHNRDLNEIMFCYVSTDQYCAFPYQAGVTTLGCNRAAVYNYASSAWYFYDLPWASISLLGAVTPSLTYADAGSLTYDQIGSSYAAQSDPKPSFLLASPPFNTSTGPQPAAVRSYTLPDASSSSLALDLPANAPMILEKSQIDLDGLKNIAGYPITLNGTKRIASIDVVGTVSPDSEGVFFTVGASNHPSETPIWGTTQPFDINFARIDCNQTGKFLALRAKYSDYYPLRISGFDLDLSVAALR